ncbi:MAG: electron transfer flavoprotein subunit alpha, partial [Clostridia bacterium]|nr:electron transfer flavoprotein subunit alpha [Clostridia bacterium]
MGSLKINQNLVNAQNAEAICSLCPFGAISYADGKLDISSACKMCKLCVKKSDGVVEYIEEEKKSVDKSEWKGVLVYVDHCAGKIHRVTYELLGKAKELAAVIGHPVYALMLGSNLGDAPEKLLRYGVDKVFVYDHAAFADFKIEPYTAAFCDFIEKEKPSSILVGATNLGRQLAPRVAARQRAGLTADCTV